MLATRYASNPRVAVVRLSDIVNRPDRLSTIDSFHPGGEAYQETARRIADLLAARPS
jgi:lysophospholipase L1-like esterase